MTNNAMYLQQFLNYSSKIEQKRITKIPAYFKGYVYY